MEAKRRYRFELFGTASEEPHVLWRHDVDVSVQDYDDALARMGRQNIR